MSEAGTKVYIVDDDEAVRDSLQVLLESYGIDVEGYKSTEDFARRFQPAARQCLILDQHLPGATGLDFLAARQGALKVPVILLTGRSDSTIRDRAHALGVRAYLEKPVADDVLVEAIAQAVANGTGPRDT